MSSSTRIYPKRRETETGQVLSSDRSTFFLWFTCLRKANKSCRFKVLPSLYVMCFSYSYFAFRDFRNSHNLVLRRMNFLLQVISNEQDSRCYKNFTIPTVVFFTQRALFTARVLLTSELNFAVFRQSVLRLHFCYQACWKNQSYWRSVWKGWTICWPFVSRKQTPVVLSNANKPWFSLSEKLFNFNGPFFWWAAVLK